MDWNERKKAQDAITKAANEKLRKQLTGHGGFDYNAPLREYGPKLTKKEWEQCRNEMNSMRTEVQRALWYAQALPESEEQKSLEDSLGWVKEWLQNTMNRMRV